MSTYVRYENNFPDVKVTLMRAIEGGVRDVSFAVERQIVGNITARGLVDTGNYRRSWTTEVTGTEGQVGSPVEYGVYLEFGTRFMPARAHVVPAAETVARRAADHFRNLDR